MISSCKNKLLFALLFSVLGTALLCLGAVFNLINHYVYALVLSVFAVVLYFCFAIIVGKRNWLDLRAVFTGVWLLTIGLASLRLTAYQEVWQSKTWILLGVAYFVFQIGATAGDHYGDAIFCKIKACFSKVKTGRIVFECKENRLYYVALITTLIGFACFVAGVIKKGFIPCFSDDIFAYINFYTKFHVFSVAATMAGGLCYYCIKTQPISRVKKAILWFCIFYNVILFPILIVSRGVFVTSAFTFTSVVFYLNKKRFIALVLCVAAILGVYLFTSTLRNFTDEQLNILFQPVEIGPTNPENDPDASGPNEDEELYDDSSFILSPKMAFLYGYLTVGHDNFNEAVQNLEEYTWGSRSLAPFNTILRIDAVGKLSESVENHFVRPYLNTNNILGSFYYDFHEIGIVVFMLLFSFVFGAMQKCYEVFEGPFLLLVMSNTVQVGALSFFENLTSRLEFWMFWGVVLIFAIATYLNIKPKENAK